MEIIRSTFDQISFITVLWLFTAAFILHEFEEWNIFGWYERNFSDLPPTSDRAARTWIVFVNLVAVAWCAAASLAGNPKVAALVFLPAIFIAVQNALQHAYWQIRFRQEIAPGIVSAILLLLPLGAILVTRSVQQNHAPLWYVCLLAIAILPGLFQTIKAGNIMTPQIRAIHYLGINLVNWLDRFSSPQRGS